LARYKNQLKKDYWENETDIDQIRFVQPMLAYPAVDSKTDRRDNVNFPAMVDRKYNGHRIVYQGGKPLTRRGEPQLTVPHITKAVASLYEKYPDLVLDGEGYEHNLRFNLAELSSILRKTVDITEADLKKSEQIVRYYVYDAYGFEEITEETGCRERRLALTKLIKDIPYLVAVPFADVNNWDEIYALYEGYLSDGYEGAIVRNSNAPYQHKRTNDLLKVKPTDDAEGIIVSINEGVGNASGLAATANMRMEDGREFRATFKGTEERRAQILKNQNGWLNKEVTFLHTGVTAYNIPNYARIDIDNCFKK
jgi:DNA ligase 1